MHLASLLRTSFDFQTWICAGAHYYYSGSTRSFAMTSGFPLKQIVRLQHVHTCILGNKVLLRATWGMLSASILIAKKESKLLRCTEEAKAGGRKRVRGCTHKLLCLWCPASTFYFLRRRLNQSQCTLLVKHNLFLNEARQVVIISHVITILCTHLRT